MKTLSFLDLQIGRKKNQLLLHLNSAAESIQLEPGLNLLAAPNGYGKTTFMQTLAGVVPPLKGESHWGLNLLHSEVEVQYISEYLTFPKFIYPSEWIEFMAGKKYDELSKELEPWIHGFSLQKPFQKYMGFLSQGERRKVTWLGAHASQKPILLMDEPLDGLDLLAIKTARDLLKTWKSQGRLIVVVAHQMSEILDLADQIYLIRNQKLKKWSEEIKTDFKGISAEVFRQKMLEFYS